MHLETHCSESISLFGDPFTEVHQWLDAFAGQPGIGMKHRRYRHHLFGVQEIRMLFGDCAAEAALRHIKSDLAQEGWQEGMKVPQDEADYVRMGFY